MVQKSGIQLKAYAINLYKVLSRTICRGLFGISEPSTVSTSSRFSAAKTGSISRFPLNSFFKPDVETKAREVWMQ